MQIENNTIMATGYECRALNAFPLSIRWRLAMRFLFARFKV
jgi:hypothetical protein